MDNATNCDTLSVAYEQLMASDLEVGEYRFGGLVNRGRCFDHVLSLDADVTFLHLLRRIRLTPPSFRQ